MAYQKEIILTDKAPKAIGPYSVATKAGGFIFTAGQIGIDPVTADLVAGGIETETRQVLLNLSNVLTAAGSTLQQVVKTTVFLRDMSDFSRMNAVYAEFFPQNPPARSTAEVAALPKGAVVEIEVVALA